MSNTASHVGTKRKAAGATTGQRPISKKRRMIHDARGIASQTADKALSKDGELNLNSFIQSREFEINALQSSMRKARKTLSARAFQQVPRSLRRRTASHNVKKVPRRLRRRAAREMIEDNTPTVTSKTRKPTSRLRLRSATAKTLKKLNAKRQIARQEKNEQKAIGTGTDPANIVSISRVPKIKKNTLANPPTATVKYKRRQVHKTWLPTHLWHAKRARMTRPTEPLWRMAIPITPTEKSYRPSHRAANSRGAIAWDASYMSTIGCLGTEHALENLLKNLGFDGERWSGSRYQKWKAGTRFASSWTHQPGDPAVSIAPILVIWAPHVSHDEEKEPSADGKTQQEASVQSARRKKIKLDRRLLVRLHPSAFQEFWLALLEAAKMQKPQVLVEDLRFEIGSIDVTGPGATEALHGVLVPSDQGQPSAKIWSRLAGITNAASLPANVLLPFHVHDPRIDHPPRAIKLDSTPGDDVKMLELLTDWPLDSGVATSPLFSHKLRYLASKRPSQKAINRLKAKEKHTPADNLSKAIQDLAMPVLLLAQRPSGGQRGSQGTWTVMAPWACVDAIWKSLMYYPQSTGSLPRFGGLDETRQIAYERCIPWFPADYAGCEAGKAWERTQAENRFDEWSRKPPSRRLAYRSIDLGLGRRGEVGRGWACDWDYLLRSTVKAPVPDEDPSTLELVTQVLPSPDPPLTQRQRKAAKAKKKAEEKSSRQRRNTSSPESDASELDELISAEYQRISGAKAKVALGSPDSSLLPNKAALVAVKIAFLSKGAPAAAARVYRIPPLRQHRSALASTAPSAENPSAPAVQSSNNCISDPPAAAQKSPQTVSDLAEQPSDLRSLWLKHYESVDQDEAQRIGSKPQTNPKTNHHQLPRKHHVYPTPDLRHIIVLPPDAPKEVVEQHGPKPLTAEEVKAEQERHLRIRLEEESVWDTHVPCPSPEDLIGFVTTGGYNMAEGRGTAIASIWLQRIAETWRALSANDTASAGGTQGKDQKQSLNLARERQLCIVRNAGESVGRLATWQFCD